MTLKGRGRCHGTSGDIYFMALRRTHPYESGVLPSHYCTHPTGMSQLPQNARHCDGKCAAVSRPDSGPSLGITGVTDQTDDQFTYTTRTQRNHCCVHSRCPVALSFSGTDLPLYCDVWNMLYIFYKQCIPLPGTRAARQLQPPALVPPHI